MALEGQPPWHAGNAQGYILLDDPDSIGRHDFAITVQFVRGANHKTRLILVEWARHHAGGRDAEPDDYFWKMMDGIKATHLTLGQLALLNKLAEENT